MTFKFHTVCFILLFSALAVSGCAGVAYADFHFEPAPPDPGDPGFIGPVEPTEPPPCEDEFCSQPDDPESPGGTSPGELAAERDFQDRALLNPGDTSLPPIDPRAPSTYVPLTPLPGVGGFPAAAPASGTNLNQYVVGIFRLSVGVSAALAVLMIVVGGVQYMVSEASGGKGAAKERIMAALQGLGLILFASLLLITIDPKILKPDGGFLPVPVKIQDPRKLAQPPPPPPLTPIYRWKTLDRILASCGDVFGQGWTSAGDQSCIDNIGRPAWSEFFGSCCKNQAAPVLPPPTTPTEPPPESPPAPPPLPPGE